MNVDSGKASPFTAFVAATNTIIIETDLITEDSVGYYKYVITAEETVFDETYTYQT